MLERGKDIEYSKTEQKAIAFYDTHASQPGTKSFAEKITEKYFLALVIIGILIVISFFSLFLMIETHETSAEVINVAGRQRMLTQRIAYYVHDLMYEENKEKYRNLLNEATSLMERSHAELTDNESELNSHGDITPAINRLYFEAPVNLDR